MSAYTASGARRTGDEYQDLQSAETLISWLQEPTRFNWVRLEAMDGSLDDIQAELQDGSRELLQVKFGVDPANEWTWDALTKQQSGRSGTPKPSLLMKWASSLADAQAEAQVSLAALVTNRSADAAIRGALGVERRINLSAVDTAVRSTIESQLGGAAEAENFFDTFEFRFLDASPDALEQALRVRFFRLGGTEDGWHGLLGRIRRWINRQEEPRTGGRIQYDDVCRAAGWHQPPVVPQGFSIPEAFVAPEAWSTSAVEPRVGVSGASGVVVVTGSPGVGKSTYLSWLVARLIERDTPVVRHHFFLSVDDSTRRRTAWQTAADAIIGQLRYDYPDLVRSVSAQNPTPDQLRLFVEAAGDTRVGMTPLVVVVDGLDHVWRDTGRADDLRELFDYLLPLPDGVVLVVGTQSIDATRLPAKLRTHAPREQWLAVPLFDRDRVDRWLAHHRSELDLPDDEQHAGHVFGELVEALFEVSSGHPLVLHYAYRAARLRSPPPRPEGVRSISSFDPGSDMAGYYQALWDDLSTLGQSLLHLLAGFPWAWPQNGLVHCLTPGSDPAQLAEAERSVRHLLGLSPAGVVAFHESLLAFVRGLDGEHQRAVAAIRSRVIAWLESTAPEFWRWRYLWSERAKAGDSGHLVSGPSVSWCVDSLVAGWGRAEIADVVAESGWTALREERLGVATERHLLDAYLEEAGHAAPVLAGLRWLALQASTPAVRDTAFGCFLGSGGPTSNEEQATVAELAFEAGQLDVCQAILDDCAEQWNTEVRRDSPGGGGLSGLASVLPLLIAAALRDPARGIYRRAVDEDGGSPGYCRTIPYVRALARLARTDADTRAIRTELRYLVERGVAQATDEVVRLGCSDGFDPVQWVPQAERHVGLVRPYRVLVDGEHSTLDDGVSEVSFEAITNSSFTHQEELFIERARGYFFECLVTGTPPAATGLDGRAYRVASFLGRLATLAIEVAENAVAGSDVDAGWFLARLAEEAPQAIRPNDHANRFAVSRTVGRVAVAVAMDLDALDAARGDETTLTTELLTDAAVRRWTDDRFWVEICVGQRRALRDTRVAKELVERERQRLGRTRDTLHVRAEEYVSLAQFALLHGLPAEDVRGLAALSARNLLGHGYHKDMALFDVLGAIREAHPLDTTRALDRVNQIAPLARYIGDITDSDETRYLPREVSEVLAELTPEALPAWLRALQRAEDHWEVETSCTYLADRLAFESEYEQAFGSTLVHEEALAVLGKRATGGDPAASKVLDSTLAHQGRTDVPATDDGTPSRSASIDADADEAVLPPSVEDFPPEELSAFVAAVRAAGTYGDEPLVEWTSHWRKAAPERLLESLASYHRSTGYPLARENGEVVVALALELEGRESAWRWLLAHHENVYGWALYTYGRSSVEWMWKRVADHHPTRWLEFVEATSTPRWGTVGGAPSWSASRMVRFLTAVSRPGLAQEVVDAAVTWGAGLAADMQLPFDGLSERAPCLPVGLWLLIDKLDCPSRMVQERAATAVARLVAGAETKADVGAALVAWHDDERLELRSCFFLLILLRARRLHGLSSLDCQGLVDAADLVPSQGVSLLLEELGCGPQAMQADPAAGGVRRAAPGEAPDFESVVRGHLAPVFLDWANELDDRGLGFTDEWRGESIQLAAEHGLSLRQNAHYDRHYGGGVGSPFAPINDRMSGVLRSTFLRVLSRKATAGDAEAAVLRKMTHRAALLMNPDFWALRPAAKPAWWPADQGSVGGIDLLPAAIESAVRLRLGSDADPVLAHAAGPVGFRDTLWADLEIRGFLQACHGSLKPSSSHLAAVPGVLCRSVEQGVGVAGDFWPVTAYAGPVRDWILAPLAWQLDTDCLNWLMPERQARGVRVPAGWLADGIELGVDAEDLRAVSADSPVGVFSYWNDEARERSFYGGAPRVGTQLLLDRAAVQSQLDAGASLCWLVTLDVAERGAYDDRFGKSKRISTLLIGGSNFIWPTAWMPPRLGER